MCSASSIQPKIRLPMMAVSGVHHQMARMTGQAATMAPAMAAVISPSGQAGEQGEDRVPFAGGHGGGQDGDDDPGDVEHDLGLAAVGPHDRFLDDRDRAVPRPNMPRLELGMTQLPLRQVACVIGGSA